MSGTQSAASRRRRDLVQEFKVQTLTFDASLGHAHGRRGQREHQVRHQQLHGTGYLFDSRIRAVPWFSNHWLYDPATGPVTEEKTQRGGQPGWLHQRWGATMAGPLSSPSSTTAATARSGASATTACTCAAQSDYRH